MSAEEFLNHIRKFEELEATYKKKYEGFHLKLPKELAEIVYTRLPGVESKHKNLKSEVLKIGETYVREIWEWYNHAYSSYFNNQTVNNSYSAQKPQTKAEANKRLELNIKDLPLQYHKEFIEMFWESYDEEHVHDLYKYAFFLKMKEVFAEFYLDDILELESDYLRYLDSSIYLMCSDRFIEEIYELFEF